MAQAHLPLQKPATIIIPLNTRLPIDTPEWLRSFPGCEHYTDEEAQAAISTLNSLAPILLRVANKVLQVVDSQKVSYLHQEEKGQKLKNAA